VRPGGAVTQITYEPSGLPHAMTDAEQGTTTLTYDLFGQVAAMTDPNEHTWTLQTDCCVARPMAAT
jgi:YD repeat-containing protein